MSTSIIIAGSIVIGVIVILAIINRSWNSGFKPPSIHSYSDTIAPQQHTHDYYDSDSIWQEKQMSQSAFGMPEKTPYNTYGMQEQAPNVPRSPSAPIEIKPLLITNPKFIQIAEQALQTPKSKQADYFKRENGNIYMVFDSIPDPAQREKVYRMVSAFANGQGIGMLEMMKAFATMFKD